MMAYAYEVLKTEIQRFHDNVIIADYKFDDYLVPDYERPYDQCRAQNFIGAVSSAGTVWVCVNRRHRADSKIGDLKEDTLEEIWGSHRRKKILECLDLRDCPPLCRGHELNKLMHELSLENPHKNFI